jgi:hypothetical protein
LEDFMKRSKILAAVLVFLLFAGCGSSKNDNQHENQDLTDTVTEEDADTVDIEPADADSDGDSDSMPEPDNDNADTQPDDDADSDHGRKQGELYGECYPDDTCNAGLTCDIENNICIRDNSTPDDDADSDSADDSDTEPEENDDDADTDTLPDTDPSGCAYDRQGNTCTTDKECGSCMICVSGGKCAKGCTNDDDCAAIQTYLKCNRKLARCVNIYASDKVCSETICTTGCCYAEKGLTGLKCATNPVPMTCGLCHQGEIYSPEDSKCLPAACSSITDSCPQINAGATKPSCYVCKAGELICAKNNTAGCSSTTVVNTAQCVPAGQMCIEGVDNCCSGNPCVNGYCY